MPILQIFRKDRKYWSESDIEQVQLFFMLHPFFSKFYEHEDFEKVVNFTFYSLLKEGEELRLEINKKSEMMILLCGEVTLYRRIMESELKKKKKQQKQKEILYEEYIKMGDYQQANQMIELRNDIIVKSKFNCVSEFIYIPTLLYQTHNYTVNNRKLQRVLQVLEKIFSQANKRDLKILAQSGCVFRQFKMNSFIYRAGSVPEQCFILVSGNVKVQSSGFSAKKMIDMSIITQNTLFGDRDLNEEARTNNAICCSAHCKILAIKKQLFNRFISKNKHINPAYAEKIKSMVSDKPKRDSSSLVKQYEEKHVLPRIMRFHSFARPEEQEKIQKDLLQNCHMLINLSPHKRSTSSFRSHQQHEKDYSVSQFDKKLSLYKRIKSHRPLDISARLF